MAKDTDEVKDPNGGEDEDRPDFIFDQELLGEEGEAEEKETFGEKTEPHLELEKDLNLDEGLEGLVSEGDIGELREPRVEEPGEKETQDKEEADEHHTGNLWRAVKWIRNNMLDDLEIITLPFYYGITIVRKAHKQLMWPRKTK